MSKKLLLLFSLFCFSQLAYSQSKKAFMEAADQAFLSKNYYAALTYYNNVLEFDEKDADIIHKSAEAARLFDSYKIAAEKYSYLIDTLNIVKDSSVYLHAGEMYQRIGQFDKATEYYDNYITMYGSKNDALTEKAKNSKSSCVWAASRIKELDENVNVSRISSEVNTQYSDFGAFKLKDVLYFNSQRFLEENPIESPAKQISKILTESEGKVEPIDNAFNKREKSVANVAFNTDKTRVYYTVCDYINGSDLRCDIFWSKVNADGTFSEEQILAFPVNNAQFTTTQPSFAIDPVTGNEWMYFVSDRPGGKGKNDIWYSVFDRKLGFSNPINLASVNTPENEFTPHFDKTTSTLYYSTDGRQGFGGFDIFGASYVNGKLDTSIILPAPYNSSFHDVYYKTNEEGTEAYFSSNREGAYFIDDLLQSCCYDVFKAEIIPLKINLNALTFDKSTEVPLSGVTVKLIDPVTGKIIAEVVSDKDNNHLFDLEKGKNYILVATKNGYKPDSISFNTNEIKKSEDLVKKLYLETDKVILDLFTFDAKTREELKGAKITIEDLSDPNNPILVQVNELGNNFQFPLDRNKTYKITASKPGYGTVTEMIDTRGSISGNIKKNLYLPKNDLNRLLPLALYFDNDEPEQDSKSTETSKAYGDIVYDYMLRKPVFMEKYGKGVKDAGEKTASVQRMEEFFEGDVRGGYDRFSLFMDELINTLKDGQKVEMTIRGYASPRFDERYNLVLGQRRINSVKNDMMRYKNGALAPLLINKQLIITQISYGEELSPVDVVDNINDEKGSIYSLKASKERKVEVISVKLK